MADMVDAPIVVRRTTQSGLGIASMFIFVPVSFSSREDEVVGVDILRHAHLV
jgi:hypothetical protein